MAACDDGAKFDPSPITPLRGQPQGARSPAERERRAAELDAGAAAAAAGAAVSVAVPPEPAEPKPAKPEKAAEPKGPSPADLAGKFRVRYRESNGRSLFQHDVVIEGDPKGGVLTTLESKKPGGAEKFARHALNAEAVAQFLAALDKSRWWTLASDAEDVMHPTEYTLKVQRGEFSHTIDLGNGCACSESEKCECPQAALMQKVAGWPKKLPAKSAATFTAAKQVTFKPPKLTDKATRPLPLDCELGAQGAKGAMTCSEQRCFTQGKKAIACFRSPFIDAGTVGQLRKTLPARADRKKVEGYFWALQTAEGHKCVTDPVPTAHPRRRCVNEDTVGSGVERVLKVGAGMIAIIRSEELRVTPVTQIWP